jgi:predicted nucleic acid-binding Zn ribbon protein
MAFPEKLNSILNSFLSSKGYLSSCKEFSVITQWKEIVGESVASVSYCENVENGILYVKVSSASWRQELSFLKRDILSKIGAVTDCHSITDIVFL